MALAYYNEFDPFAAAWLRALIADGHIAPGDVDERSIEDVHPDDLRRYTQCHFFAGIGVWSYALRRAGWDDDRPIWTASCPCQPFSAAGKSGGFVDERHLWPAFHHLFDQCRPAIAIGEQVASKDGLAWLDLVRADVEGTGYAFGAVDTCAAGFGAPHIRQRLYWVADAAHIGVDGSGNAGARRWIEHSDGGGADRLADNNRDGRAARDKLRSVRTEYDAQYGGGVVGLADNARSGRREERADAGRIVVRDSAQGITAGSGAVGSNRRPAPTNGFWADPDWLFCRDGKWRPVEPGTFPLAHGAPARVGRLRGYGNAINAEAAIRFIESLVEARNDIAKYDRSTVLEIEDMLG